jgi:hypothetical protein
MSNCEMMHTNDAIDDNDTSHRDITHDLHKVENEIERNGSLSSSSSSSFDDDNDFESCSSESSSLGESYASSSSSYSSSSQPSRGNNNNSTTIPFLDSFSNFVVRKRRHSTKTIIPSQSRQDNTDIMYDSSKTGGYKFDNGEEKKDDVDTHSALSNTRSSLVTSPSKWRRRRHPQPKDIFTQHSSYMTRKIRLHWSTYLLAVSVLLWSYVQILCYSKSSIQSLDTQRSQPSHLSRPQESTTARSNTNMDSKPRRKPRSNKNKKDKEALPPGCEHSKWQQQTLLQCNALHELDLNMYLGRSFSTQHAGRRYPQDTSKLELVNNATTTNTSNTDATVESGLQSQPPLGRYLSSGLWRDVWSLQLDHYDSQPSAVLKMMRMGTSF